MLFSSLLEITSKKDRSAERIKQVTHENKQGNNLSYSLQGLGLVEYPAQESSCIGNMPDEGLKTDQLITNFTQQAGNDTSCFPVLVLLLLPE